MRAAGPANSNSDARKWVVAAVIVIGLSLISLLMLLTDLAISTGPGHHVSPTLLPGFLGVCSTMALAGIFLIQASLVRHGFPATGARQRVRRFLHPVDAEERRLIHFWMILLALATGIAVFDIVYSAVQLGWL